MIRPVLLAAIVACSLGASLVAVQPASGDIFSETPTPDGPNEPDRESGAHGSPDGHDRGGDDAGGGDHGGADEDDDRWYDGWGSDGGKRSDGRTSGDERSSDRSDGDDADRHGADDRPDERERGGADEDDEDDEGSSEAGDDESGDDDDGTDDGGGGTDDDAHGTDDDDDDSGDRDGKTGDGDDEERTDGYDRTGENGSAESDRRTQSASTTLVPTITGRVLDGAGETVRSVTSGTSPAGDRDGVTDHVTAPDDGAVTAGPVEVIDSNDDAVAERLVDPHVGELLPERTYEVLDVGNGTVEGVLDGVPVLLGFDGQDEGNDGDRPSPGAASDAAEGDGAPPAGTGAGEAGPGAPRSAADVAAVPPSGDGTSDRDDDEESGGEAPAGGPAGAGAALVVTVGCLGGPRVAVTQASLLAPPGSESTLASLRGIAGEYLGRLPDGVVPPVLGYSRNDGSDPLENETRAEIYDVVRESPGIYHAKLSEETGVTVETVRYHCRVLAEEGLVEPRKHRGRRRLYPVSMDGDDPDLAAAIADSAAADVLSAIERLEPTTLTAVADAVDCAPSTVSYHLDRLEEDGLVTRERDGGAVRVRLRRSTRSALRGRVADD